MRFPNLSSVSDVCHRYLGYGSKLFFFCLISLPSFSSFGIFQRSVSHGITLMFTYGTRSPCLLYFACRMCGVYLEWPQLLSGQHLKPVRNVLSCVHTQAAIRDILSCPTYRCIAGSTLVSVSTVEPWCFMSLHSGL
jgi:hypothetical protein